MHFLPHICRGWSSRVAWQATRQGDRGVCCSLAVCTCAFPRPPRQAFFCPPGCQCSCLFVMWIVFCLPPLHPPGMFVPSLAVGAAGGRLAGRLVAWMVAAAGSKLRVSLAAYSVIGALP